MASYEYKTLTHTAAEVDQSITDTAAHIANTSIHVTQTEKNGWDAKASSSDLSAEVTARENADEALQTAINGKASASDLTALETTVSGKAAASDLTAETTARENADSTLETKIGQCFSLLPATAISDGTPDSDGYKADILTLPIGKWSRATNLKYVKNRPSNFTGVNDSFYVTVEYVISTSRKKITMYPLNDTNGNHLCWVIYQDSNGNFGNWHYFGGGTSVTKYADPVT